MDKTRLITALRSSAEALRGGCEYYWYRTDSCNMGLLAERPLGERVYPINCTWGSAAEFVFLLRDASIPMIAIENPIGQLNWRWRYPDQTIQPYQFGHPFSKATCLWLKNLPLLKPTQMVEEFTPLLRSNTGYGRKKGERWSRGHTQSAKEASRTFPGIAEAMAKQWGSIALEKAA